MANARIRFKTEVTADTKTKADLKGKTYHSSEEATLPKDQADSLVKGGFADYLDESGNVIYEENTRAKDAEPSDEAAKGKAAKSIPEEERAQPGVAAEPLGADEEDAPSRKTARKAK